MVEKIRFSVLKLSDPEPPFGGESQTIPVSKTLCGRLVYVVEELFGGEEALNLSLGALGGVGSVADIKHAVGAEITADGTLVGLHGVGRAKNGAHAGDNAGAAENKSNNGAGLHESRERGEEGLVVNDEVDDVGVMLTQNGIIELHHLQTTQAETLAQKALQDDTGEVLTYAVRLKENKCFFVAVHNMICL